MLKNIPPSPHFTPIDLDKDFNCKRSELPSGMIVSEKIDPMYGEVQFRGIPFSLGKREGNNVILLDKASVTINLCGIHATYIVFAHVVREQPICSNEGIEQWDGAGNISGKHVSNYILKFTSGEREKTSILRRFAIQQHNATWGASGFACVPCTNEVVFRSTSEDITLGKNTPNRFGDGESRVTSGRDEVDSQVWLYALPNPKPEEPIHSICLEPCEELSLVYGLTVTMLSEHPLRYQPRRKLLITLPSDVTFNAIDEIDDLSLDMGVVISARRQKIYDHARWNVKEVDLQPILARDQAVVEYSAHPFAILYIGKKTGELVPFELKKNTDKIHSIAASYRPVSIKVIDKETHNPVGVRIHFHGEFGEYLPPKGYHRKVNKEWFEDNYGEYVNQGNEYAYIRGECVVDLPLGKVYVEITRGYEVSLVRQEFEVFENTSEVIFELERVLDWRSRGWVSADTHVHFLSPTTAILEGEAEDINVVNLLASQWGEMFSNVGDFDGATTYSNTLSGNDGEFLVRVGTENRMQALGHISLLGYSGSMIHPLCSGGPSESAVGDFQEITMAEWAERCIAQNGLVVMPHAPNPQLERVADVVLDLVHAIEFASFNPFVWQLSPVAIADWYRFLNLGYHLPIVGGSDKMAASSLLGGIRTYVHLEERSLTYENWMDAIKAGNTFVTVGPLVEIQVEGVIPGKKIILPESGGTLSVVWRVESVQLPVSSVEVIVGGKIAWEGSFDNVDMANGTLDIMIDQSTWIAVRVRGTYDQDEPDRIAAHTSAVQVLKGDSPIHNQNDAVDMLRQIEGSIAYIDTIACRPDADRYRKMQLYLESAYNRLHQRMHQQGVFHQHSPLHKHGNEH